MLCPKDKQKVLTINTEYYIQHMKNIHNMSVFTITQTV